MHPDEGQNIDGQRVGAKWDKEFPALGLLFLLSGMVLVISAGPLWAGPAQEEFSEEDQEIIENLEFLENWEFVEENLEFLDEDLVLTEDYEILNALEADDDE
jgi:hypothetical protein